jgi:DNA-directed RNA polymerase specialized sigma24 family protein
VAAEDADIDASWETEWRDYHLRRAMQAVEAEFNRADRAAFAAYALQGRDAKAVAAELGLSVDQVYQAKTRVLRRVSQLIERQVAEEG